jgi:hypothetical protein
MCSPRFRIPDTNHEEVARRRRTDRSPPPNETTASSTWKPVLCGTTGFTRGATRAAGFGFGRISFSWRRERLSS